jgi:two-component system, NtrC family, nitrogen regulation response regulator GlnG
MPTSSEAVNYMRVLLAEDDAILADVITEALTDEGHSVTHVSNVDEAHRIARDSAWDLLIFDSFGHSFDEPGEEERRRLADLTTRAPVILSTGRAWAQHMQPAEIGVAAILPKPFDLESLLDTVRGLGSHASVR